MTGSITLHGVLGKKYGRTHMINVTSAAEAMRALEANYRYFSRDIKKDGKYAVIRGGYSAKNSLSQEEVFMSFNEPQEWHIVPLIQGAGGKNMGFLQIIIGAILIVASIYFQPAGAVGYSYLMSSSAFLMGVALVLSGVATLLSPMPQTFDGAGERADEKPSYLFNGPKNTTEAGGCVPVVYGEHWVGSKVISAGISVEDIV